MRIKTLGIKEISGRISEKFGLNKKLSCEIAEEVFQAVPEMIAHAPVKIPRFGIFKVVIQKERNSRNPYTNEPIIVPEKRKIKFVPS